MGLEAEAFHPWLTCFQVYHHVVISCNGQPANCTCIIVLMVEECAGPVTLSDHQQQCAIHHIKPSLLWDSNPCDMDHVFRTCHLAGVHWETHAAVNK